MNLNPFNAQKDLYIFAVLVNFHEIIMRSHIIDKHLFIVLGGLNAIFFFFSISPNSSIHLR
jgi:hypothetical protein